MSQRVHVVMAYQPGGHPSREKPARLVRSMFSDLGWRVHETALPSDRPYNCGHAKNAGVRALTADPDDVLVLADADCVTRPATLKEAVWLAYTSAGVVWSGTQIRVLDEAATARLTTWEEAAANTPHGEVRPADSTPQLLAIRRDFFEHVGGYDESYIGYGFEDYDFRRRCEALAPLRAAPGTLVHIWHEPDPEKANPGAIFNANRDRWIASGGVPWND